MDLREQLDIVICLRSIESSLFFSFGASKWCFLGCTDTFCQMMMMMISEDILAQNLSLQKSDIDKYISPSCIKLKSKLMVQNLIEEE